MKQKPTPGSAPKSASTRDELKAKLKNKISGMNVGRMSKKRQEQIVNNGLEKMGIDKEKFMESIKIMQDSARRGPPPSTKPELTSKPTSKAVVADETKADTTVMDDGVTPINIENALSDSDACLLDSLRS
jgi:hypothetical protein